VYAAFTAVHKHLEIMLVFGSAGSSFPRSVTRKPLEAESDKSSSCLAIPSKVHKLGGAQWERVHSRHCVRLP
jgi:hypothetical protein